MTKDDKEFVYKLPSSKGRYQFGSVTLELESRPYTQDELMQLSYKAGYAAALEKRDAKLKIAVEVLEHYYPILRQYGCTRNGDHDDSSWCTELCCDYGKRARQALAKIKEGEEK